MRNEFDVIDLPGTAIFLFALLFVYVLVHACLRSKIFIVSFYHKKLVKDGPNKTSFEITPFPTLSRASDPPPLDPSRANIAFAKVYKLPSESLQKCGVKWAILFFPWASGKNHTKR